MPFLQTSNTNLYYDIFEPNFTASALDAQEILLIYGFTEIPGYDSAVKAFPFIT